MTHNSTCYFDQASSKVEVDYEAAETMQVTRSDFEHALETDIKPVSYNCYMV